jgi:TPR repeat protein
MLFFRLAFLCLCASFLTACLSEAPSIACARLAAHPAEKASHEGEAFGVAFEKIDTKAAIEVCAKAIEKDPSPQNKFRLARVLMTQKDPSQDVARATRLYQEASDAGYAFGDLGLGYLHYTFSKNGTKAYAYYMKAAKAGVHMGNEGAAFALTFSPDTKARRAEGIRLLARLAGDNPKLYLSIAYFFETETPTAANLTEAVKAYELAAKHKIAGAELKIAWIYFDKKRPLYNLVRARSWGQKAVKAGDLNGYEIIARSYYVMKTPNDRQRQKNFRAAYDAATKGARAGNAFSGYLAGFMLAQGQGVKRDTLAAEPLLKAASARGSKAATDFLRKTVAPRAKMLRNMPKHSAQSCVVSKVSTYDRNIIDYFNKCDHTINVVTCERHVATEVLSFFDQKNREYCKTKAVGAGRYITNFYGANKNSAFLRKAIANTDVKVGACHRPLRPRLSRSKVYCDE